MPGYKSIKKWPQGTDVASQYHSTKSDPSPNCALSVLTCITSRGELKKKQSACSGAQHPAQFCFDETSCA